MQALRNAIRHSITTSEDEFLQKAKVALSPTDRHLRRDESEFNATSGIIIGRGVSRGWSA